MAKSKVSKQPTKPTTPTYDTYAPEARMRLERNLTELDAVIDRLQEIGTASMPNQAQIRIENRQYLFSVLLETYATWHDDGDCLPKYVKLGRYGNKRIVLTVEGDD